MQRSATSALSPSALITQQYVGTELDISQEHVRAEIYNKLRLLKVTFQKQSVLSVVDPAAVCEAWVCVHISEGRIVFRQDYTDL